MAILVLTLKVWFDNAPIILMVMLVGVETFPEESVAITLNMTGDVALVNADLTVIEPALVILKNDDVLFKAKLRGRPVGLIALIEPTTLPTVAVSSIKNICPGSMTGAVVF